MDQPVPADLPADHSAALPSLEQLAADLAGVERALERLEDGSYWTDEVTGAPIPDEVLAEDPTARRARVFPDPASPTDDGGG